MLVTLHKVLTKEVKMKKITKLIGAISIFSILSLSVMQCYGSYALTKKVHSWNATFGNNIVNTVVYWGLIIIPVYPIAFAGDFLIFNTIESVSGSNPIAMVDGEVIENIAEIDGKKFYFKTTKNKIEFFPIEKGKIEQRTLTFNDQRKIWTMTYKNKMYEVAKFDGKNPASLIQL